MGRKRKDKGIIWDMPLNDLKKIFKARSNRSQKLDKKYKGKTPRHASTWARHPNRYDLPGIDKGKKQRRKKSKSKLSGKINLREYIVFWRGADTGRVISEYDADAIEYAVNKLHVKPRRAYRIGVRKSRSGGLEYVFGFEKKDLEWDGAYVIPRSAYSKARKIVDKIKKEKEKAKRYRKKKEVKEAIMKAKKLNRNVPLYPHINPETGEVSGYTVVTPSGKIKDVKTSMR